MTIPKGYDPKKGNFAQDDDDGRRRQKVKRRGVKINPYAPTLPKGYELPKAESNRLEELEKHRMEELEKDKTQNNNKQWSRCRISTTFDPYFGAFLCRDIWRNNLKLVC